MRVVILEDDVERVAVMAHVLRSRFAAWNLEVFDSSYDLVDALRRDAAGIELVSLDHDLLTLDERGHSRDLGTGRDVADFLAGRPPEFPVVIHSSNGPAADGMERVLQDARWQTVRVSPYDDLTWIEEAWFPAIRHILQPRKAQRS